MTGRLERAEAWLLRALADRCDDAQVAWAEERAAEIRAGGVDDGRFAQLLSLASRFSPRGPLDASLERLAGAASVLEGWNPERWTALETVRVRLVVARALADDATLPDAIEEAFRYADEGELCALYRSLQLFPGPERFVWRAGEGCRTNMRSVFEANACDTAFPVAHLDDVAWRQLCVKALFVEAPLWRVHGLDGRIDSELTRMVLDLVDERRSAGRPIYPELWLCLGHEPSERALASVETELAGDDELSRKGAILALGRMGETDRLREIERDGGSTFSPVADWALLGRHDQAAFAAISIPEGAVPQSASAPAS
ncbi:MAG: EboA domain-containing protein [Planctomycetota bacterium]